MVALLPLNRRRHVVPAHTPHLVERVGLLTIIMLGESVISISAALADIAWNQSNVMAAVGTVLFFLGKQYGYYMEVPELRPYLLSNTAVVFALTALVLMLPLGLEAMLVGITATMICYVLLNLRYRHLVLARQVPA